MGGALIASAMLLSFLNGAHDNLKGVARLLRRLLLLPCSNQGEIGLFPGRVAEVERALGNGKPRLGASRPDVPDRT